MKKFNKKYTGSQVCHPWDPSYNRLALKCLIKFNLTPKKITMPLRHHCILNRLSHDAIHLSFSLPTSSQSRYRSKIYLISLESGRLIPVNSGHSLAKWPTLELHFIFPTSRLNLTCCSDNIHLSHIQNHHRRHSCWMVTTMSQCHNIKRLGNKPCDTWGEFLASQNLLDCH